MMVPVFMSLKRINASLTRMSHWWVKDPERMMSLNTRYKKPAKKPKAAIMSTIEVSSMYTFKTEYLACTVLYSYLPHTRYSCVDSD
jgi:hypothetical protein